MSKTKNRREYELICPVCFDLYTTTTRKSRFCTPKCGLRDWRDRQLYEARKDELLREAGSGSQAIHTYVIPHLRIDGDRNTEYL